MKDDNLKDMYEGSFATLKEGEIIKGRILKVLGNVVIVDLGFKSEGILPIEEFRSREEAKEGDEVFVFLERLENRQGVPVISKKRADFKMIWNTLQERYEKEEPVEAVVKKKVKGGLLVEIFGRVEAFLPASHVDLKPSDDVDELIGKEIKVKITQMNPEKLNLIVSRRLVLEEERMKAKERLFSQIKVGEVYEVTVKNLTDFGLFCDLNGVDVLLPISEIAWDRVDNLSETFAPGQKIKTKVIAFDKSAEKVTVSLKQLTPHPWAKIEEKYPIGSRIKGKVTSLTEYGAFVEVEKGVEGLIHISEMSWTKTIHHPSQILRVGDEVEVIVLDIDRENRRISLGLKQTTPDPWSVVDEKYKIGDRVFCTAKFFRDYGVFCEIEEGIEGLIRNQDLSWTKKVNHPKEVIKKGQRLEAVILDINKERRRILLSLKHTKEDPLYQFFKTYKENDVLRVKVLDIPPTGLVVSLPFGLEGFVHQNQLRERERRLKDAYKIGQELELSISKIDLEKRRILLSERGKKEREEELKEKPLPKVKKKFRLEDHLK